MRGAPLKTPWCKDTGLVDEAIRTGMNRLTELNLEGMMYFAAAVLAVLSGLFYAAGHNEIGSLGVQMCRYGGTFCDSPIYVLAGAALAAIWGAFVSVR
jgi:hypothetical protein